MNSEQIIRRAYELAEKVRRAMRGRLVTRTIGVVLALSCGLSRSLAAGEGPTKPPWDLQMVRFEFDNDNLVGSDPTTGSRLAGVCSCTLD
ncbi:MAG TPA: hypothetical protein VH988_24195 [Thermoanaerobaculia bacterium]|jgi:hypothetical protein|nr:hypothetical protein [Thermoanaerobaculia bacterium]